MDKIPELFLKLLENSSLTTLFFGGFLMILGGAEKIPLGNTSLTISSQAKLILLVVGLGLTVISALTLLKIIRVPRRSTEVNLRIQQQLEGQRSTIAKLEEIIKEIREFVESRTDDVSLSLLEILDGVKDQAREFEKAARESRIASQWLTNHYQSILQLVKISDLNNQTPDKFRAEIQRYVELLVESLDNSKYIAPSARNITSHIGNPFPYMQVLQSLKIQIKQEVDRHQSLREEELRRLNDCIDKLIDDIRYESSL